MKSPDSSILNSIEFEKYTWDAIESYFIQTKGKALVNHQLESFNDFILNKIEEIIEGFNTIEIYNKYVPALEDFEHVVNIEVKNPKFTKPTIYEKNGSTKVMTPMEARQRNFSYSSSLYIDLYITCTWYELDVKKTTHKQLKNVNLGKLPIMVGSNYCILNNEYFKLNSEECRHDYGGYFIINGNEKVIISQDRISENKTYVFLDNKVSHYSHIAEIRSVPDNIFGPPKLTSLKFSSKPTQFGHVMKIAIHHIKVDIPLFILFRALGIESDRAIVNHVTHEDETVDYELIVNQLKGSIEEANFITTRSQALDYLSKHLNISGYPKEIVMNKTKRIGIVVEILTQDFIPHVGDDLKKKALYVGYMTRKLISCLIGITEMDDRDSYLNKRVDSPGVMMANLFRQYYGRVVKDIKNAVVKELNNSGWKASKDISNVINANNIYKIVKANTLESGLKYALATGNWGIKNGNVKQGVAQVLNRLTYNATLSHLRRINTPMEKSGKLIQPRKLHNTQWGIICPAETPEGSSVGLVKNLAIATTITIASDSHNVRDFVKQLGTIMYEFTLESLQIFHKYTKVFINGDIVGVHKNPNELYVALKKLKHTGIINIYTCVSWNILQNMISISTEGGRCVRPMFIVESNNRLVYNKYHVLALKQKKINWNNLVSPNTIIDEEIKALFTESVVEFIDVEEQNTSMIAMNILDLKKGGKGEHLAVKYTHMEIHPSLILGVLASNIPFPDHNQSPRNCYQSAMGKQAIGIYATNYRKRLDTLAHVLNYPQQPLVKTHTHKLLNCSEMPCGMNVIVAIATYTGFNQEDSIMVNKSSVERGMFNSTFYRTYKEQCNKNLSTGEEEIFCKPSVDEDSNSIKRPFNYDKLSETGFVEENTFVNSGDVMIGKCMPQKLPNAVFINKDNSIIVKNNENGYIDMKCANDEYFKNTSAEGYTFAKIKVRNFRQPTIGDKLSSTSGQKGSIGMIYSQEDMPFNKDGLVPDIIINPHAIPSRMTIAQLLETIMGKVCTHLGTHGNATPFTDLKVNDLSNILLHTCGMEEHGNDILYNSRSGEQIETEIFIGPTYYQRLKHMVCDKMHSRNSNGPIVLLTRQPAEGRARDGGLRLGEMEVECNWGHGTMNFLKERFMECSDNYRMFICRKCARPANVNPERNIYACHYCLNKTNFAEVRIPFASKLFTQEIQSMGIGTKLLTN